VYVPAGCCEERLWHAFRPLPELSRYDIDVSGDLCESTSNFPFPYQ